MSQAELLWRFLLTRAVITDQLCQTLFMRCLAKRTRILQRCRFHFEKAGKEISIMHIPRGSSSDNSIPDFETALLSSGEQPAYDRDLWIYVPGHYDEYRYILGTRGSNPLICIGINPSTAEPGNLDNTLKSVSRISAANGFDSWIMFNVYAQRATNPDDMDISLNRFLHEQNMEAFRYILSHVGKEFSPTVWAAWGTVIEKRPYLPMCLQDMIRIILSI